VTPGGFGRPFHFRSGRHLRGTFVMDTSKPPPGRGSGPITDSDWSLGINATLANPMADAALLAEIGRKLRRHYQALTEEALPEHFLEIVDRFPTDPHETPGDGR
jgi:hypothetical protein